jgi:WD40 repeat protein
MSLNFPPRSDTKAAESEVSFTMDAQQRVRRIMNIIILFLVITSATGLAILGGWLLFHHAFAPPDASPHLISTYRGSNQLVGSSGYHLAWSPDSKRIAFSPGGSTVDIWNIADGEHLSAYTIGAREVLGLAWSPDGARIAASEYSQTSQGYSPTIQVWDAADGSNTRIYHSQIRVSFPYSDSAFLSWSPDGDRIVSAMDGELPQVWDASTGQLLFTYTDDTCPTQPPDVVDECIIALAWSPDGTRIASAGYDGKMQVWSATDGHLLHTFAKDKQIQWWSIIWSPDSKLIIAAHDGGIVTWNADNGRLISEHPSALPDAWSPDGKFYASSALVMTTFTGIMRVWETDSGHLIYTIKIVSPFGMAWSPNGKYIAVGSGAGITIQVWQLPSANRG